MDVHTITAVEAYFTGERQEGLAILAFSIGIVLVAVGLYVVGRDGFSRGFGAVALALAILLSSTVVSLMRRDAPHQAALVAGLRGEAAGKVVAEEASRIDDVIRKYPYYRGGALVFGVLALAAVAFSRRDWVHGAAAGLLVLVIAQIMIDHYSEARATRYSGALKAAVSKTTEG